MNGINYSNPVNYQSMTGLVLLQNGGQVDADTISANTINFNVSLLFQGNPITTTQVAEGINLYFTTGRARISISSSNGVEINIPYNNVTGVLGPPTITNGSIGNVKLTNSSVSVSGNAIALGANYNLTPADCQNGSAAWNANKIQGITVTAAAPSNGDYLFFDGGSGTIKWTAIVTGDAQSIWTRPIKNTIAPTNHQFLGFVTAGADWEYLTIANTDITGLGTMSTQNANNVNITGGTMSGVNISGGQINSTALIVVQPVATVVFNSGLYVSTISNQGFGMRIGDPANNAGTLDIVNNTNGRFTPQIIFFDSNAADLFLFQHAANDSGSASLFTFNPYAYGPLNIANRVLFNIQNNGADKLSIAATGDVTLTNKLIVNGGSPAVKTTVTQNNATVNCVQCNGTGTDSISIQNAVISASNSTQFAIGVLMDNGTAGNFTINAKSPDTVGQYVCAINGYKGANVALVNSDILLVQNNAATLLKVAQQGNVSCPSTTGAFIPPILTTTQRNALTPIDGMIVYNSTIGVVEHRALGAWTPADHPYIQLTGSASTQQTINASTNTLVALGTIAINTNSNVFGTGVSTITCKVAGTYRISAGVTWTTVSSLNNYVLFILDGGGVRYLEATFSGAASNGVFEETLNNVITTVAANTQFSLNVFYSAALGTATIGPSAGGNRQLQANMSFELVGYQ